MIPTEEQERHYNEKYGYRQRPEPSDPRPRYRMEGKPGAWEIIDGITVVERFKNRGHALAALRGYLNPRDRKVRYTFRKVYRFLRANGWVVRLNEPPDVYWWHQGSGIQIKENRQMNPRAFLLACYTCVPGTDKETLQAYWTWHHERSRLNNHGT